MSDESPVSRDPQPIVCPMCLANGRAQRVRIDPETLNLVCPTHGAVFTVQQLEH